MSNGTKRGGLRGTKVTLFVPFSGAAGLFHMRPSSQSGDPPHGTVRGGETLLLHHSYVDSDSATVKREHDHQVASVKERVSSINSDVDAFNADLSGLIHGALTARLDKLRADAEVVAALGVPRRQHHTSNSGGIDARRYRARGRSGLTEPKALAPHTPRGPGRPQGPYLVRTRAEIEKTYRDLWTSSGRRPYWNEVARRMRVDERTLRNARQHFGLDERAIDKPSE
jgi:hypothetical protein